MTPENLAAITAAIKLIEQVGGWPLTTVILCVFIGPWLMAFILARGQERRFEAMKGMYESNAKLVEGYEKTCQTMDSREQELRDLLRQNTQAMTHLTDVIKAQGR